MNDSSQHDPSQHDPSRRHFLQTTAALGGLTALAVTGMDALLRDHFLRMDRDEVSAVLEQIEHSTKRDYNVQTQCTNTPSIPGVRFGFALNLSKCKGTRDCVMACIQENNCGRNSNLHNIRVLEIKKGGHDFIDSDPYYQGSVPKEGKGYLPIQCHHCENPPCVRACPVEATWKEPDGIVVIDYDWCIGCRYCAVSCPYGARHFNWKKPQIPVDQFNPQMHYLGNRPRPKGVMEKCTFCIQRTRLGRQPACQEACPTGARIFGDLADPDSEIQYLLKNQPVYRLKEDQNTNPTFWYFTDAPL